MRGIEHLRIEFFLLRGQKEMLMPIAGKKPAKEAAAKKPSARSHRKSA